MIYTLPAAPAGKPAPKIDWQTGRPACHGWCVPELGGKVKGAGSPVGRPNGGHWEEALDPQSSADLVVRPSSSKRLSC